MIYDGANETFVETQADSGQTTVDIDALKKINPEIVGWLIVEDADISYPIVQGPNNDKYLKLAYDGTKSSSGSIFMNSNNAPDLSNFHTLIYGHHMRDKSMFGKLMNFEDPEYLKEHRYFTIYNEFGTHRYEIFSAYVTYSASFVYNTYFEYSWDYFDFIEKCKESSIVDMGVEVTANDKIVTLSTCTSRGKRAERFVVQGKLLPPEEAVNAPEAPDVTAASDGAKQ